MAGGTKVRLELGVEIEKRVLSGAGTRDDIALVLEKRPDIFDQCAAFILVAVRELKNRLEFIVKVLAGETFDSLIAKGKYDWKNDWITEERFPVRQSENGDRKLVVLHFGRTMTSEQVLEEARKQGLERPLPEDALRFGAQFPDVQKQFPLVFLHEPVRGPYGNPDVLILDRHGARRRLNLRWFDVDWCGLYRFVFVSK